MEEVDLEEMNFNEKDKIVNRENRVRNPRGIEIEILNDNLNQEVWKYKVPQVKKKNINS